MTASDAEQASKENGCHPPYYRAVLWFSIAVIVYGENKGWGDGFFYIVIGFAFLLGALSFGLYEGIESANKTLKRVQKTLDGIDREAGEIIRRLRHRLHWWHGP